VGSFVFDGNKDWIIENIAIQENNMGLPIETADYYHDLFRKGNWDIYLNQSRYQLDSLDIFNRDLANVDFSRIPVNESMTLTDNVCYVGHQSFSNRLLPLDALQAELPYTWFEDGILVLASKLSIIRIHMVIQLAKQDNFIDGLRLSFRSF
jgi:hypothetical protein